MSDKIEHIKPKRTAPKVIAVIVVLLLIIGFNTAYVVTYQNQYTLVKQFGKVEKIISEAGLNLKIPFVQTTSTLPKSIQIYDMAASDVITQDKKSMVADCYVLWKIDDPKLFVQSLNSLINAESRINITVYNSVKAVISSLDQADVISGRDGALNQMIMANIGTTMEQYGITLISVETKHLDLPSDNKDAVYARMISERNNKAATYTAEGEAEAQKIKNQTDYEVTVSISQAEAEAEKTIASGEAEYMKILSEVYADESRSDFYTFVLSLDAAKAAMVGDNKTLVLNSDSPLAEVFNTVE